MQEQNEMGIIIDGGKIVIGNTDIPVSRIEASKPMIKTKRG
jgi:hypothetical protein